MRVVVVVPLALAALLAVALTATWGFKTISSGMLSNKSLSRAIAGVGGRKITSHPVEKIKVQNSMRVPRVLLEPANAAGKYANWLMGRHAPAKQLVKPLFMLRHSKSTLERLEATLLEVSTPGNPRYGKHLSRQELDVLAAPMEGSREAVLTWLKSHGVSEDLLKIRRDSIQATMTVEIAEAMFQTQLHQFFHRESNALAVRAATPYSVPSEVAEGLYMVGNLMQLPAASKPPQAKVRDQTRVKSSSRDGSWVDDCGDECDGYVTPGVLWKAYQTGEPPLGQNTTSMAIAQFQGVSYDDIDLNNFQEKCNLRADVKVDTQIGVNNAGWCRNPIISDICIESLLDVSYIKGVGGDIPLTDISDEDYSLLNWATAVNNMTDAPPVHSVSYGDDEVQQTDPEYMDATNAQFMQMGAAGMSVLFASGDQGVYGRTGYDGTGRFHPDFPASSPWITSVGGTNFVETGLIGPEEAWSGSGGGFSDQFQRPSYQDNAVEKYFGRDWTKYEQGLPNDQNFNRTGRGYPDVSALGGVRDPYCVDVSDWFDEPHWVGVGGTSASCPVVAAIFARLNALRHPMPALGFLNPFIYQNPQAFNDVKAGMNNDAGPQGFVAVRGWDPATGMGTPNFPKLKAAAMKAVPWAPPLTTVV